MKSIKKLYYWLGFSAVSISIASTVLSITLYILGYGFEYMAYTIVWAIVFAINYVVWRKPPRIVNSNASISTRLVSSGDESMSRHEPCFCGELRELAELIMILYTLKSTKGSGLEYSLALRTTSLLDKIGSLKNLLEDKCGSECSSKLDKILSKEICEENVADFLESLNQCMIKYGCFSNIVESYEENT